MSALVERPTRPALRRLVDFYDPATLAADSRGRQLENILEWEDIQLEFTHDYIQTLFPLPEGSMFAYAPIIDEQTFLYWRQHSGLKQNLRRAFARILSFYGFVVTSGTEEGGEIKVTPKGNAGSGFRFWLKSMDHNHLRITRIIRSLRVLGLKDEAVAFYAALASTCASYGRVGRSSQEYWRRAAESPLHVAPDGTEIEWLQKYEAEEQS
ncbi:opioid growth factor receptor conserved region-domain-containing protein [Xylariales sp. PMI_506]|nr:opioid growth factor receptor conserved region-domain-containing protein [Xylariales sp. PMI_506]